MFESDAEKQLYVSSSDNDSLKEEEKKVKVLRLTNKSQSLACHGIDKMIDSPLRPITNRNKSSSSEPHSAEEASNL